MKTIEIIWATAACEDTPVTTKRVETDKFDGATDLEICEKFFHDTNLYEGTAWDVIQPLPDNRTHTSLSVGDYVVVDEQMYRCARIGWEHTNTFEPGLNFTDPLFPGPEDI